MVQTGLLHWNGQDGRGGVVNGKHNVGASVHTVPPDAMFFFGVALRLVMNILVTDTDSPREHGRVGSGCHSVSIYTLL